MKPGLETNFLIRIFPSAWMLLHVLRSVTALPFLQAILYRPAIT